jgi:hypothetical protein
MGKSSAGGESSRRECASGERESSDEISSSNDKLENVKQSFVNVRKSARRIYNPYSKISKQVSPTSQCNISNHRGLH